MLASVEVLYLIPDLKTSTCTGRSSSESASMVNHSRVPVVSKGFETAKRLKESKTRKFSLELCAPIPLDLFDSGY